MRQEEILHSAVNDADAFAADCLQAGELLCKVDCDALGDYPRHQP
jgi:hypothetical protein